MIKSHITKDIENANLGIRPFIFDIVSPDGMTSLLPDDIKLTLHANPEQIEYKYTKQRSMSQTLHGFVEYYWGDEPTTLSIDVASGAFIRPYTGLSAITGPVALEEGGANIGGTRRDTITYDKYLDLLAMFHSNGSIYDSIGQIVLQGKIKVTFDGGTWFGWFQSFSVTDDATSPYQFKISLAMQVEREYHGVRSQSIRRL
jgi:hypothetical protein